MVRKRTIKRGEQRNRISKFDGHTITPPGEPPPMNIDTPRPPGENGDLAGPESSRNAKFSFPASLLKQWTQSALALQGQTWDYNPDDLVQSKGDRVRIYQDMIRDPYVKAGLHTKKLGVIRLPSSVLPASDDEIDKEVAEFVEHNMEEMDTPLREALWGILDAVNNGYSILEQNWKIIESGRWKGMIGTESLKGKDPWVYTFRIGDFGDVETIIQRIHGTTILDQHAPDAAKMATKAMLGPEGQLEYPPNKFIITSFQKLYNNPYGMSDLRAAYRAFFIKDWAWKFRAIFMEKFGMPPIVGTFPNGTTEPRRQQLEDVIESIQSETSITIPEDLKIDILRIAEKGPTEYERAIADLNKEILIGIVGSFLAFEEGKKTGARAASQTHFQINKLFIEELATLAEEVINRQYIKRLVDFNFTVEKYPKWHLDLSRVEELIRELELDKGLKDQGITLDPAYYFKKYGRPTPTQADIVQPIGPDPINPDDPGLGGDPNNPESNPSPDNPADPGQGNLPGFNNVREESIPKSDDRDLGKLREMYSWYIRMWESAKGLKKFSDRSQLAYELAGVERRYKVKAGKWMSHQDARKNLLSVVGRG